MATIVTDWIVSRYTVDGIIQDIAMGFDVGIVPATHGGYEAIKEWLELTFPEGGPEVKYTVYQSSPGGMAVRGVKHDVWLVSDYASYFDLHEARKSVAKHGGEIIKF